MNLAQAVAGGFEHVILENEKDPNSLACLCLGNRLLEDAEVWITQSFVTNDRGKTWQEGQLQSPFGSMLPEDLIVSPKLPNDVDQAALVIFAEEFLNTRFSWLKEIVEGSV